jgi:hypothetical protein
MVLFEILQLARVFLDYLRIEYLWHVLIMPLTNRNGIRCLEPAMAYISLLFGSFIAPSLNGADSAGWFMNNPG